MDPQWVGALVTAAAAVIAAVALVFAGQQAKAARKSVEATSKAAASTARFAEAELILRIDELLREHQNVHEKLRPGGAWRTDHGHPQSSREWSEVEAYMGLLERLGHLTETGVLTVPVVSQFYGYRIKNVWHNDEILQKKLCDPLVAPYWRVFIALSAAVSEHHDSPRLIEHARHHFVLSTTTGDAGPDK